MAAWIMIGTLPPAIQAENNPGQHTAITLTAGSVKDYWTNSIPYLMSMGDRNGMILTDDTGTAGVNGAVYQKLAMRSEIFDKAFTKSESEEGCDIVVNKGETFYIAVKHNVSDSGYAYLSGFDTVLTYTAGAFSPETIGGNFGSHPANRLMSQTVLASSTPNVQQAALETGLMSKEYEYSLSQELEKGKEGVCVRFTNPSVKKPPVASQTGWDVLIPLTANQPGVYTIEYTDEIGSLKSSVSYADALMEENPVQVFSSANQIAEGNLQVNDIRVRVLSGGPELTSSQSALYKEGMQQITLKLNKNGAFHEAACTSPAIWNAGILSGGTVTGVQKIETGLAADESAVRLTIDTAGITDDRITIVPDASVTADYADCGWISLAVVSKPAASVDLSAGTSAVLQISSATDRYKISGDAEWTTAGAKTVYLTGNSEGYGPLDRLQAAVADGMTVSDAITVISKNDDQKNPAAAQRLSVSRAAAQPSPVIDFKNETISGMPLSAQYAFDTNIPDHFTDMAGTELVLAGHEPGSTLYYRTKSSDAATAFPSHVQSLFIPERPVLQPVSATTSTADRELGYTALLPGGGEAGLEYAVNSAAYTDLTENLIPAVQADRISIRRKATASAFCSLEQQLDGEGFAYGTVTGQANHGTASAKLELKGNGVTFEKAEQTPIEVVLFDQTDGSRVKNLAATADASAGSTVMHITLTQSSGKAAFDSQHSYFIVLPKELLSEKQEVNQHKTLGESIVSARGYTEIELIESGHKITNSSAAATAGSGKDTPYPVQLSEAFIPSGQGETEVIVENLRSGEQIQSVRVNGAAVSITKITYDPDTGTASFFYPEIAPGQVQDVNISIETQPVVKKLSATEILWDVGSVSKVYDATSSAPENIAPACSSSALYNGHSDIAVRASSIDFVRTDGTKAIDTGTGLKIIASGISITGTDSAYYELPEDLTMELAANGSITKAKATGFALVSPINLQSGSVNAAGLIDKIFSSQVLIHTAAAVHAPTPVPLSDFIGSAENTTDRNRLTGALFASAAGTSGFEQFLGDNLPAVMAILSVAPASGDDTAANSMKNKQAVLAAAAKLDNPQNSGQAAVMRSLLQAYLGSMKSGTTFQFELPASTFLSALPEGNYDFSALQSGISGSIAIKAEGDLDDDEETTGDLYLVVFEVDPVMGRLTGNSAEKVQKGKTPASVPSVTANSRYTFEGWLLNGKTVDPGAAAVTADVTFTADFVKGFLQGDGNGSVRPASSISRAEFVKMVVYTFGADFSPDTLYDVSMYRDVPESQWYRAVIGYATKMKWISGHEGNFRPNDKITRQEAAKVVSAAMDIALNGGNCDFADTGAISDWAVLYVAALSQKEILGGYEDSTFRPLRNISRAEAASMLGKADGFKPDAQRRENIRTAVTLPFSDIAAGHWSYPEIAYACGAIDQ